VAQGLFGGVLVHLCRRPLQYCVCTGLHHPNLFAVAGLDEYVKGYGWAAGKCERAPYYGSRVAVPRPSPVPSPGPPPVFIIESCWAPGPMYMLKVGPSLIEIVPVQFAATV
jgi:hypothetical protein